MSNAEQAFPEIQIQCKDRYRSFCLNLGAFRAIEEHMQRVTENPKFSVLKDYDWNQDTISHAILMVWAGMWTDARKSGETWTLEDAEDVVSIMSMDQVQYCVSESLKRVLTPEQFAELGGKKKAMTKPRMRAA